MQMPIKSNHIPPIGDYTNLFERLSKYISRFDEKWVNEIEPAKKESIDTLKNLTQISKYNYHFPKEYEIYLHYMGQDDKGLLKTQLPGYASISEIIDSYEAIHEEAPDTLSDKYIHFFQKELFDGQLSFDFTQTDNTQIVITNEDSQFVSYFADNFEKLLFQCAFSKYERLNYDKCIIFAGSPNMLKEAIQRHNESDVLSIIDKFSKTYDFQRAWFSDLTHYIGFKDGISFYIERRNNALCGFIAGDLDKQIDNIGETLLAELCVNKKN
ncbi:MULTISPECIES: SMI1/KNR4 family protein [Brevibacillus]|uniref:SMI1/KNR4 family protein n=1 Tax=Brevibacillus TaxID=55080 RepID=UPI000D10BDD7|nr:MULTISPECIES: SMI1/KNR4 family protein [Brevibacillus]MED1948095.1 SMI1/KNR4 family protein [Brevibacillus formosus]MED1998174.1 SMI1/KNR4 family protein [Brevibacillus formosus]MED2080715.1 SMI1/KNR4 family protein [Brevibacillus formosus]PSK20611.1 SMI1/KNR4 family protein [Brevibacillus sp. NRRL NRS-603]